LGLNAVKILLITGWGGGTRLLNALKENLAAYNFEVELINIFNVVDSQVLQEKVELAKQFDVIMGWSLGGQLATVLVDQIQQQNQVHKILITLASNPCFVANPDWSYAMSIDAFQQFKGSFFDDAITTLKKFGFMVCQGVGTSKEDFKNLQSLIQAQNLDTLRHGLDALEVLNNVDILQNYAGHQYHLFGKQDYLVSYKVERKIANLAARYLQTELFSGSHGFPVFEAKEISCKLYQYLEEIKKINE
jgi:pimeloyl-[acyl-carrier protein] methyl ester esterase